MTDLLIIVGLTLASCVAIGLIGLFLLHVLRYRSLRHQLTIATLLPVVAVATTVLINVQLMFLSAHDSLVILIALLVSLVLAALGAWLVVRRISHASRRVGLGCTSSSRTPQVARQWSRIRSRLPPRLESSHKLPLRGGLAGPRTGEAPRVKVLLTGGRWSHDDRLAAAHPAARLSSTWPPERPMALTGRRRWSQGTRTSFPRAWPSWLIW